MGAPSRPLKDSLFAQLDVTLRLLEKQDALAQLSAEVHSLRESAVVEALHDALGAKEFITRDITALAASRPQLNAALVAALGVDWNPKKLGKLLAELRARDVGGYMVSQLSTKDRAGSLWVLKRLRVC